MEIKNVKKLEKARKTQSNQRQKVDLRILVLKKQTRQRMEEDRQKMFEENNREMEKFLVINKNLYEVQNTEVKLNEEQNKENEKTQMRGLKRKLEPNESSKIEPLPKRCKKMLNFN